MQYLDALRYLDERSNYERTGRVDSPSIENIERLMDAIANPQHAYRSIHITGTNGKGSTAQITTKLLMAHGLRVGTYSSPHLDRINDRICINGEPISDEEFGLQFHLGCFVFLGLRFPAAGPVKKSGGPRAATIIAPRAPFRQKLTG